MSITTRVDCLFLCTLAAWGDSVVGMAESTVVAHRIAIDFSPAREVFSFVADPLAGDPCPSLTSPHSPWPSVCFINDERGRCCCLDRMSWIFNTQSKLKAVCTVSGMDNGDFIVSVSLGVHCLILHLIARTLPAHLPYILHWDLAWNVGRFFMVNMVLGINRERVCFSFFCMLRGTQRTLTGVQPLVPKY